MMKTYIVFTRAARCMRDRVVMSYFVGLGEEGAALSRALYFSW